MWQLSPFSPTKYQVAATAKLRQKTISLEFHLFALTLPYSANKMTLTTGKELWTNNCVEFFWQDEANSGYYELNLSLTGQWNIYHFHRYRQGMRDITDRFSATVQYQQSNQHGIIKLDFPPPATSITNLQLAAIIYDKNSPHYFALKHAKTKPDFHLHSAFSTCKELQIK